MRLVFMLVLLLSGSSQTIAMADSGVIPDVLLVDRQGRESHIVADVMGDRVTIMNFIYTGCSSACPVSTAIMKSVHNKLIASGATPDDVVLVSVSINPVIDTPELLKQFANTHGASGEGWYWLTGSQRNVDRLLLALHTYTAEVSEHPSVILVGDARGDHWVPLYGFPKPDQVMQQVKLFLERRKEND